jgi:hypothetical protein
LSFDFILHKDTENSFTPYLNSMILIERESQIGNAVETSEMRLFAAFDIGSKNLGEG